MHKTDSKSAALSSPSAALTRYKATVCEHSPQRKFVYRWLRKRLCQRRGCASYWFVSAESCAIELLCERKGGQTVRCAGSSVAVRGKQTDNGTDNLKKTINMGKISGKMCYLSA